MHLFIRSIDFSYVLINRKVQLGEGNLPSKIDIAVIGRQHIVIVQGDPPVNTEMLSMIVLPLISVAEVAPETVKIGLVPR